MGWWWGEGTPWGRGWGGEGELANFSNFSNFSNYSKALES